MLAAAALRLTVIEALCPTAALLAPSDAPLPFPTLACRNVFDSAFILPEALEEDRPWTPSLSVFSGISSVARRGDSSTSAIGNAETDLVIVAELAAQTENEAGFVITDSVLNGDPLAQITLEALTTQVRAVIVRSPLMRRPGLLKAVPEIRVEPFGLPHAGVRYMRNIMICTCQIADDKYTDEAGLPEPMRTVAAGLPDGSYAKSRLAEIGAAFRATTREQLDAIDIRASVNGRPVITPPAN